MLCHMLLYCWLVFLVLVQILSKVDLACTGVVSSIVLLVLHPADNYLTVDYFVTPSTHRTAL